MCYWHWHQCLNIGGGDIDYGVGDGDDGGDGGDDVMMMIM